ncbi:MAG: hypothetical protein ACREUT_18250 [Steroidobacteraceae bacterium]
MSALWPCLHGSDPLLEKIGNRYRVRSRYLRPLRADSVYRAALQRVSPALDVIGAQ